MAFRVFLSHSLDPAEVTLAWRLQTLAAAHGIEMYVPQHGTVVSPPGSVPVQQAIDRADCVLAIITAVANPIVQHELGYALEKRKLVISIVRADLADHPLLNQFSHVSSSLPGTIPARWKRRSWSSLRRND